MAVSQCAPNGVSAGDYAGPTIEFGVLGPLEVRVDGRIVEIGGQRERVVVATLLLTPTRAVSVDRLCDAVWGGAPPASWNKVLQNVILRVRKRIGAGVILRTGSGYMLVSEPEAIDARRFEQAVSEARQYAASGAWEDVGATLSPALSLWRGEAVPELAMWPVGVAEATRFAELRRSAMEEWAAAELACGRNEAVIADLESMATDEPLRERRWELLALALYRAGRQVEALRVFLRARDHLADTGLVPSVSLRDLERRMVTEDPNLIGAEVAPLAHRGSTGPASLAPELLVASPYPFVGRRSELNELEAAWHEAVRGRRMVALVSGTAGIGKSRLVREFAALQHASGVNVFHGRCDSDAAAPYQPFVSIVEQIARWLRPHERAGLVEVFGELQRATPGLHRLVPGLQQAPNFGSEIERERLFAAADELLDVAARRTPSIAVLEDVHWAGEQTLSLLRRIAHTASDAPLLILVTHRDEADEVDERLAGLIAQLQRVENARRIGLVGLEADDLDELVAGAARQETGGPLREVATFIAGYTSGNPFYSCELWKHLTNIGAISRRGDGRWSIERVTSERLVPLSIREVITDRLGRLSPVARAAIELSSVAGRRCDWRVLVRAIGQPEDSLANAFDELVDTGLIEPVAGPWLAYQFSHELVRNAVDGTLRPVARAGAHLRLGRALAAVHAADLDPVLPALARHFTAAARLGDPAAAVDYSLRAATLSMRSFGHVEAIALLEPLIDLTTERSPERLAVLLLLGDARRRQGSHIAAREAYMEAFLTATAVADNDAIVQAALGFEQSSYMPGRDGRAAAGLMRAAIGMIPQGSSLALRAEAAYARALALAGEAAAAEERFGPILIAARERTDMAILAAALGAALSVTDHPEIVLDRSCELLAVSEHTGDPFDRLYALTSKFRAEVELGRLDDARVTLDAHAIAVATGEFEFHRFVLHTHRSLLALADADFELAEWSAEQGHELVDVGREVGDGVYGVQMFLIRREQDRLDEVLPIVRFLASRADEVTGVWRPGLAALYAELEMLDEAARQLDELSPGRFATIPRDGVWPLCAALLADTAVLVGDADRSSVLYDELLPLTSRILMAGMTACLGPCDRYLGRLALVLGRHDDSARHLARADEMAVATGSPLWRAQVALDLSRLAAALDNRKMAQAKARLAAELAARHNMTAIARHASVFA